MGLKTKPILFEDVDEIVDKTPEKLVRERRHLDLLEKVKRLQIAQRGKPHPVLSKLKGIERARRRLEKDRQENDYDYASRTIQKGELNLGSWWNAVREEFSDLDATQKQILTQTWKPRKPNQHASCKIKTYKQT